METGKLVFQDLYPSLCHLLTFLTLFIMSPIIVLFGLTFSKSFNLHEYFIIFYLYIYIFFQFIFNLSHVTIACHKFFAKFLVRYYFFFQICIFIPFIRLALILSGDIEINRRQVYFFNIVSGNSSEYLRSLLPMKQYSYNQARGNLFRNVKTNTEYFKNYFFPYCVEELNKLGSELKESVSISKFKKSLLAFIRPKMSPVYKINDPLGLKLLTRLRVNFSHLR